MTPLMEETPAEDRLRTQDGTATKRKQRQQAKESRKRARIDAGADSNENSIALTLVSIQADFLAAKQAAVLSRIPITEREALNVSEDHLVDVAAIIIRESLADFVSAALPDVLKKLSKPSKKNGSPRVLVVAAAALRVANLCRDLRGLTGGGEVAKLFAKHFKLAEHIDHCQKSAFNAAVRREEAVRAGMKQHADALQLSSTEYLILDTTFRNEKGSQNGQLFAQLARSHCTGRNLFEQPEARDSLFTSVLCQAKVLERLKSGKMKLVLF